MSSITLGQFGHQIHRSLDRDYIVLLNRSFFMEDVVRFLRKIQAGPNCCNILIGSTQKKGYVQFSLRGAVLTGHRIAYELWKEPIPEGRLVCHTCDNPRCVNPNHLFLGDPWDNTQDAISKQRLKSPPIKKEKYLHLLPEMKRLYRLHKNYEQVARELNVSAPTVVNYLHRYKDQPE